MQARASQPPLRPRVPLHLGHAVIGSVEPGFVSRILAEPTPDGVVMLQKSEHGVAVQSGGLEQLARTLQRLGLAGAWRNEALGVHAVVDDQPGERVGTIERGAVRPLGIVTQAVHLVGRAPDGSMWVQQRAWNKPNDPGQWDTLMGGMVAASDTLQTALARETQEEAGLDTSRLHHLRHGGRVTLRRPSTDGKGMGYMVEHIDWFEATVPDGIEPVNQDGEVARFERLSPSELRERLHAERFTLEASLILAAALQKF
jgi:8-oxo-dGTP pyrophosphatase MutT (NUDIX family)